MDMICFLCSRRIRKGDAMHLHHPTPKSEGGQKTEPTHRDCHIEHHSTSGQFAEWGREGGKQSALTKRWALNLRNVNAHPAHDLNRSFYIAHYAH